MLKWQCHNRKQSSSSVCEAEGTGHLIFTSRKQAFVFIAPPGSVSSLVICEANKMHENHFWRTALYQATSQSLSRLPAWCRVIPCALGWLCRTDPITRHRVIKTLAGLVTGLVLGLLIALKETIHTYELVIIKLSWYLYQSYGERYENRNYCQHSLLFTRHMVLIWQLHYLHHVS